MKDLLVAAARGWIRYAPMDFAKWWLWSLASPQWRDFECSTVFGAKITGNTEDLIQRHIYYFGVWEPHVTHLVRTLLRPGDVFVDVGANIGYYTLLAAPLVGDSGRVVAIEAAPWIHDITVRHVALNQLINVRTINAAATDRACTVQLYMADRSNLGTTSIVNKVGHGAPIAVPGLPMDQLLTADEVARVRMVKIDVEGAEPQVLRSMMPLLPRMRHDVAILAEVQSTLLPGGDRDVADIFALMKQHGFTGYEVKNVYSARAYMEREPAAPPTRIDSPPKGFGGDVLFSRMPLPGSPVPA